MGGLTDHHGGRADSRSLNTFEVPISAYPNQFQEKETLMSPIDPPPPGREDSPPEIRPGEVPSVWGEARSFCPGILTPRAFSSSVAGESLAVLFSCLGIDLQAADGPLSDVYAAAFRASISPGKDQAFVSVTAILKGFVFKTAGARAVAMLSLGGTNYIVEFPYGEVAEENFDREFSCLLTPPVSNGEATITGAILLLLERRKGEEAVLFSLDSLDIIAVPQ